MLKAILDWIWAERSWFWSFVLTVGLTAWGAVWGIYKLRNSRTKVSLSARIVDLPPDFEPNQKYSFEVEILNQGPDRIYPTVVVAETTIGRSVAMLVDYGKITCLEPGQHLVNRFGIIPEVIQLKNLCLIDSQHNKKWDICKGSLDVLRRQIAEVRNVPLMQEFLRSRGLLGYATPAKGLRELSNSGI